MHLHERFKFRWNDVGCTRELFYICEKEKNLNEVFGSIEYESIKRFLNHSPARSVQHKNHKVLVQLSSPSFTIVSLFAFNVNQA